MRIWHDFDSLLFSWLREFDGEMYIVEASRRKGYFYEFIFNSLDLGMKIKNTYFQKAREKPK